jgi:hypothetical protein
MPVFQGIALLASGSLTEATGVFLPAPPSIAASSIADTLVRTALKSRSRAKKPKLKTLCEDVLELGRHIGLNDVCWYRPSPSQPDFAHLCMIVQIGQGDILVDSFWCLRHFDIFSPRCTLRSLQNSFLRCGV